MEKNLCVDLKLYGKFILLYRFHMTIFQWEVHFQKIGLIGMKHCGKVTVGWFVEDLNQTCSVNLVRCCVSLVFT